MREKVEKKIRRVIEEGTIIKKVRNHHGEEREEVDLGHDLLPTSLHFYTRLS